MKTYKSEAHENAAIKRALDNGNWTVGNDDRPATDADLTALIAEYGTLAEARRASLNVRATGWIACGSTRAYYQA